MRDRIAASTLFVLALAATDARAGLITNGSFENTNNTFTGDANSVDVLSSGSTAIPGWTTTNGVPTAWIKSGNPYDIPAADGDYFLDLTSYSNVGTYGGVAQSVATVAGTSYVVTFDLGYGGSSGTFAGPVSVLVSAAGTSGTLTSGSGRPNPAVWTPESFTFTATSSLTQLDITGTSTAGGQYIGLDNVDVEPAATGPTGSTEVPEPGTYGLFLAGIGSVAVGLRRRSNPR